MPIDMAKKIVGSMPLEILWDASGFLQTTRGQYLTREDIQQLLKEGAKTFVVANPGDPLRWIPKKECFLFWKSEVKPHVSASYKERYSLSDYPDGYFYVASEWLLASGEPIILLENMH